MMGNYGGASLGGEFWGSVGAGAGWAAYSIYSTQPEFALAAGSDSCVSHQPPPPPPINWHVQKPKSCSTSSDHCHTAAQNGTRNGPQAGNTHAGQPGVNPSATPDPFAISQLTPDGGVPTNTRDPEDDCMSGNWIGNSIDYWPTSASNGNRATGADACLNSLKKGNSPGTNPLDIHGLRIMPPGSLGSKLRVTSMPVTSFPSR